MSAWTSIEPSRGETEGGAQKGRKKMKATGDIVPQSENEGIDSETDDEGEEEQVIIDWAMEWRQKPGGQS